MNEISAQQRGVVKSFREFTGASVGQAIKCLKQHNWDIQTAANDFFINPPSPEPQPKSAVSAAKMRSFFDRYAEDVMVDVDDPDAEGPVINFDGIEKLCVDVGVDANDIIMLIFAWHCEATTLGEFTWEEFQRGCEKLQIDSPDAFKKRIESMRAELIDPISFKRFYAFVFDYGREGNQKSLDQESAVELWKMLLADKFPHLKLWSQFLTEKWNKAISRDTWNLLLEFATQVDRNFTNYDPDGAWPVLIDEFVEYALDYINK